MLPDVCQSKITFIVSLSMNILNYTAENTEQLLLLTFYANDV